MILGIGLDSFDTPYAACTTHLASLILLKLVEEEASLADYPWLVRLNPAVPWKTRGNGAVALFVSVDSEAEARRYCQLAINLAKRYALPSGKEYLACILLDSLGDRPPSLRLLYKLALSYVVEASEALQVLRELRVVDTYGGGRGVVGALAALGADLSDCTFELIAYRQPEMWGRERRLDHLSVLEFEYRTKPYTFLNYDYEANRPLITPHGPDPVLYGVRGLIPEPLLHAPRVIDAGETPSHWTIFRTNQGTGAHYVLRCISTLRPYEAALVVGRVKKVREIPGPHLVALTCDHTGCIHVMFYRETGRLIHHARKLLRPGTRLVVGGLVKPHREGVSLNAEIALIEAYHGGTTVSPPRCPHCGQPLVWKSGYYRCPNCKTRLELRLDTLVHGLLELRNTILLLPSASAYHHLMIPPEKFWLQIRPPAKPTTPLYGIQEFTER